MDLLLRGSSVGHRIAGCQSIDGSPKPDESETNKERGLFLNGFIALVPSRSFGYGKNPGTIDTRASVWSLDRRSGCFPALPCPPSKPADIVQNETSGRKFVA